MNSNTTFSADLRTFETSSSKTLKLVAKGRYRQLLPILQLFAALLSAVISGDFRNSFDKNLAYGFRQARQVTKMFGWLEHRQQGDIVKPIHHGLS